jgi:hypothetical protein
MERADSIEHLAADEQGEQIVLDDATLEPAAQIEAGGDYPQSEAIEAAMTELIDGAQEEAAEGGKRAFGRDTFDPNQHYSGVNLAQGEVKTDQDWNEEANAPPTEEIMVEGQEQAVVGALEDRPLTEVHSAASQAIARVFVEDGFHDRLMEDPDTALAEHGLSREDLPDLGDLDTPEADAFLRDIQNRVIEGVGQNRPEESESDLPVDLSAVSMQTLAWQLKMDKNDKEETTTSTTMSTFTDTVRNIIANIK